MLAHPLTADRPLYRAREREDAERAAEAVSWWRARFEDQAGSADDPALAKALFALADAFEERAAELAREAE